MKLFVHPPCYRGLPIRISVCTVKQMWIQYIHAVVKRILKSMQHLTLFVVCKYNIHKKLKNLLSKENSRANCFIVINCEILKPFSRLPQTHEVHNDPKRQPYHFLRDCFDPR